MLQIGIRQRTKKMIFIHGIGQGVLRHQIWSRVEQYYPDCSCRSATRGSMAKALRKCGLARRHSELSPAYSLSELAFFLRPIPSLWCGGPALDL